ncbi:hypothetical protein GGTG_03612 [Gaeumannomyces tritici R3-111a-1]|uniref:Uncharacterized protein n=1 Tax=Gaeumannomyces tritici (strain R3-111a-1) TaxID=644352 RepID=J3NQQ6_GAET3|nr:hypothetical protein GGTG_03612 [Gaeumannomyces tritici R3-111a-1]EJT78512.1 hypothetical protein GGTG_03612 [Gaeumannomyces tritici R3-111a-1]
MGRSRLGCYNEEQPLDRGLGQLQQHYHLVAVGIVACPPNLLRWRYIQRAGVGNVCQQDPLPGYCQMQRLYLLDRPRLGPHHRHAHRFQRVRLGICYIAANEARGQHVDVWVPRRARHF